VAPLKKRNKKQIDKINTAKKTIKNLKMHTEGFKTTNKERNFNIQEFYKTKIITSMTVNHTNPIRQAQQNFTNRKLTSEQ
jgi:predicted phage tail protein